jgi:hypothetical protein
LTSEATWRAPADELIRVGPFRIAIRVPGVAIGRARRLVSSGPLTIRLQNGVATFEIDGILDHEVVVLT